MSTRISVLARHSRVTAAFAAAVLVSSCSAASPTLGTPTPTPTPEPSQTTPLLDGDALEPGTYQLTTLDGVTATITVPDGWGNIGGIGVGSVVSSPVVVFWPSDAETARVYADPCQWLDSFVDPPVGPTVDDLATALANQPQRGEAVPTDVSIDGYQGKMIELSVPDNIHFADCDRGLFKTWDGRNHQAPGQIDRIYILDVGGQRLLIDAHFLPGTSEADLAEQQEVFDSIQIEPPA